MTTTSAEPVLLEQILVAYLFERLLFDSIERNNNPATGTAISPIMLATKFAYIARYYDQLALKQSHHWRGRAITRLGLHTASGIITFFTNHRSRFKVLPDHVVEKLKFGDEVGIKVCQFIVCPVVMSADMADMRRGFVTLVPDHYRKEVEFLMGMLEMNGLLESGPGLVKASSECLVYLHQKNRHHGIMATDIERLEAERPPLATRKRKEQELIASIKDVTSMDTIVLNSLAQGINASDYDLELLLVEPVSTITSEPASESTQEQPTPRSIEDELVNRVKKLYIDTLHPSGLARVRAIRELATTIKNAGFKSILLRKRYSDVTCNQNPYYVCFYDPKTQLTCQITLYNPNDIHTRELLQAYASIDDRVDPFIFAAQKMLDNHGRSREALSNYAVAIIAIHYLQTQGILPKLLHHQGKRIDFGFFTGKAVNVLPKYSESVFPQRSFQVPRPEDPHVTNIPASAVGAGASTQPQSQGRRGRRRPREQESAEAADEPVGEGAGGTSSSSYSSNTTTTTGDRLVIPEFIRMFSYKYDEDLAKKRPFDRSRGANRRTVVELVYSFFNYMASKFEDWEDRLVPGNLMPVYLNPIGSIDDDGNKCSMFMPGTALTRTPDMFSGLVVQDPFILDRNVAWLCTGWRFMNTSKAFQRVRETVSCGFTGGKTIDEMIDDLIEEQLEEEEEMFEMEESGATGLVLTDRILEACDDFGDTETGPRLKDVAEHLIAATLVRPGV
ncbi:hypothetical protein BGX33_012212 [Mortierella sp. NVP41]|nr:hypothetical protein BGX33_012212 [Mortierella sp. NVP41]